MFPWLYEKKLCISSENSSYPFIVNCVIVSFCYPKCRKMGYSFSSERISYDEARKKMEKKEIEKIQRPDWKGYFEKVLSIETIHDELPTSDYEMEAYSEWFKNSKKKEEAEMYLDFWKRFKPRYKDIKTPIDLKLIDKTIGYERYVKGPIHLSSDELDSLWDSYIDI